MITAVLLLLTTFSIPNAIYFREINSRMLKVSETGEYLGDMSTDACPPYCGEVEYLGEGLYKRGMKSTTRGITEQSIDSKSLPIRQNSFNQFVVTVDGKEVYPNIPTTRIEVDVRPVVNITLLHPKEQIYEDQEFSVSSKKVAIIPSGVVFNGVNTHFNFQLQSGDSNFDLTLGPETWTLDLNVKVSCGCNGHGTCLSTGCYCHQDDTLGYWEAPDCLTCSPSYGGPFCRDACPQHFNQACNGHGVCITSQQLQPFCQCDSHWSGSACDDCAGDYYGYNCELQCPSTCPAQCYKDGDSKRTGTGCVCTGNRDRDANGTCSGCQVGFYASIPGGDCTHKCSCSAQGTCRADGQCDCAVGFYGPKCDLVCKNDCLGFYGAQCMWENDDCKPVRNCTNVCDNGDCVGTVCHCNYGFTGPNCATECPKSRSGNPCFGNGVCNYAQATNSATCNCTGNYDPFSSCSTCLTGWSGKLCNESCIHCGPLSTCMEGICICNSNTCGPNCTDTNCTTECDPGKYGPSCTVCRPCEVSGGMCDDGKNGTGSCLCPRHKYGDTCQFSCYSLGTDSVPCSGSGSCSDNGCVCQEGYSGDFCEIECGCLHRNASILSPMMTCQDNETCTCDPSSGFVGPYCGHACPGLFTSESCLGNGRCEYSAPLQKAICTCTGGWTGPTCGICSPGWGGTNCDERCPLFGGLPCSGPGRGDCVAVLGEPPSCRCKAGYEGVTCQCTACSGLQVCLDGTDYCQCPKNLAPPDCSSCAVGYYPPDCTCDCNGHGTCKKQGVCECDARYSGLKCDICDVGFIGESCEIVNKAPQREDSLDLPFYKDSGAKVLVPSIENTSLLDETIIAADAFFQTWSMGGSSTDVTQVETCTNSQASLVLLCDNEDSVISIINQCHGTGVSVIGFDKNTNGTAFTTTINETLTIDPLVDATSVGDRLFMLQSTTLGCFLEVRNLSNPSVLVTNKKLGDFVCERIAVFSTRELIIVAGGFKGILKGFDFNGDDYKVTVYQPPEFTHRWTVQSLALDSLNGRIFLVVDTVTSVTVINYNVLSILSYSFIEPATIPMSTIPMTYPATAHALICDPYAEELYVSVNNIDSFLIRYRYRTGLSLDGILDFGLNRGNSHIVSFSADDNHRILYALDYSAQIKIGSFLMFTVREFDPPTVSPKTVVAAVGSGFRGIPSGPLLHDSNGNSMELTEVLNETHAIFTVVGSRGGCHGDVIYMALEAGSKQARRFAFHSVTGADFRIATISPQVVREFAQKVITVTGHSFQDSPYLGCRFGHPDAVIMMAATALPKEWVNRSTDPIVTSPIFSQQLNAATFISSTEIRCLSPRLSAFDNITIDITIDGQQFQDTGVVFSTAGPLDKVVLELADLNQQSLIENIAGTATIPPILVTLVDKRGVLVQDSETVQLTLTPTWRLSLVAKNSRAHGLPSHCSKPLQRDCTATVPESFDEIVLELNQQTNISGEWNIHTCSKEPHHELVLVATVKIKSDPTWSDRKELVFPIPLGKPSQILFGSISSVSDAFRVSTQGDICLFPLPDKVKLEPVILVADFAGNVLGRSEFGNSDEISVRGAIVPVSEVGESGPPVAGVIKSDHDSIKLPSMSAEHGIGVIYSISVNATFGNVTHRLSSNSFASNCFGGTDECCFPHADCNVFPGWVVASPGRYFPTGSKLCSYECPEGACEGFTGLSQTKLQDMVNRSDTDNIQVRCNDGAVPGSPLCSICKSNYGRSLDSKCQKCPENTLVFVLICAGALIGLTVYSVFTLQQGVSAQSSIVLRMIFSHLQVFSNLLNIGIKWQDTEAYDALHGLLVSGESTSLSPSANVNCYFAKLVSPELYIKYSIMMCLPLVFIPVGVIIFLVSKACGISKGKQQSSNWVSREESRRHKEAKALEEGKHIALANKLNNYRLSEILIVVGVVVFFVMYQMLAVQSASMFTCIQLNDGNRYMRLNLDQACEGSLRNAGLIMLIIYGLGVPLFLCLSIVRYRARHSEDATKMVFAFLLGGFKGGIFKFWQCVVMLRKLLVVITLAYFEVTINSFGCEHSKTIDDKVKIYAILWILTFFLLLQIKLQPYARRSHNLTETVAHASLVLTIHLGLIYFVNPSNAVRELIMYIIVIINIAVFVIFIWQWIAAIKIDAKNKLGVAEGEKLVDAARKAALAKASKFVDLATAPKEQDDTTKSAKEEKADMATKQEAKEQKRRQLEEATLKKEKDRKKAEQLKERQIQNDFESVRQQIEELEMLEKEKKRDAEIQEVVVSDPTIPPKASCKTQRKRKAEEGFEDEDPYTYKSSEIEVSIESSNPLNPDSSSSSASDVLTRETIRLVDNITHKVQSVPVSTIREFGYLSNERLTGRPLQNTMFVRPSDGNKIVVTFDNQQDVKEWYSYLSNRLGTQFSDTTSSIDPFFDDLPQTVGSHKTLNFKSMSPPKRKQKYGGSTDSGDMLSLLQPGMRTMLKGTKMKNK